MATRIPGPEPYANRQILPPDSKVRDYVGLRFLGAGGMGTVYKGFKDDVPYVLKEVPGDQSSLVLALTQEKALLERLRHPGLVRFHQLFEENGFYYMVLEFINGCPLSALPSRPDENDVRDWGTQLCDILEYLHTQDPPIIYRDLKPENVLLEGRRLRLIDFGIARLYKGDRESDTELMGSIGTASPEHYGGTETDVRSDVYTVGACLYELLTGGKAKRVAPFQFAPVRSMRPEVSEEMEAILQKCTSMQPAARYQTMAELKQALHQGTVRLEVMQRPVADSALKPVPSRRGRASLLGALGLLAVLGLGLIAWRSNAPSASPAAAPTATEAEHNHDPGLPGLLFGARKDEADYVVTLGEDIGLFQIAAHAGLSAAERATQVSARLNSLYHTRCEACGRMLLHPDDILIGRYKDPKSNLDEVVLFYAHYHGTVAADGPVLLATVDKQTATRLKGATPRFAAGHWRNLLRDLVQLSRGEEASNSLLGEALREQLLLTRRTVELNSGYQWVMETVSRLDGEQTQRLQDFYKSVPKKQWVAPDAFPATGFFAPLRS